jgi:hypothetical protein
MTHTWTAKHTSIAESLELSRSARLLWEWLVNHSTNIYKEVEFDLVRFNKWVARIRGKGAYDPRTLKRAAEELVEKGIAVDLAPDRFKWNWKRWKFEDIYPKKSPDKSCPKRSHNADLDPSNADNTQDKVIAAAALTPNQQEVIKTCEEVGISYSNKSAITWATLAQVKAAIALFFHRGGFSVDADGLARVDNPQGFLIKAIKRRWIYELENAHVCGQHLEVTGNE